MTLDEAQTVEKSLIQNSSSSFIPDSDGVIYVNGVSKKFCRDLKRSLFYGVGDIFTDLTGRCRQSNTLRTGEFWALDNVSFQLRRGEALGLVGANGAGKSTLLRILSGLIKPDTGSVRVRGRIAPLIALGAGFNPILTGRENIYANMAILGLSTQEIEEKFEDVVEFAEIQDAIDAPVQTYSSGMAARLGFACAIHVEPEILLIDEVLAVGDVKFKMKCHHRLAKLKENGTAFILVSHNPYTVLNVCENSIYLRKGQLVLAGETESVIHQYEKDLSLSGTSPVPGMMTLPEKPKHQSIGLDILALFFRDEQDNIIEFPSTGEPASFCVKCRAYEDISSVNLGVLVTSLSGESNRILNLTSVNDNATLDVPAGQFELQMYMPYCCLIPGVYSAKIYVKQGVRSFDIVRSFRFRVDSRKNTSRCMFYQPRSWRVVNPEKIN
ncbi:MAG: ABC transporter ATP-binding protein [Coleofasciculus sp. B1-GNL1-01]|uniref:ABC transporter ATP-binding protein n=1 Tax=Coleofasciculus sp. B1-GNL1-01 TaxID=3068484 RepID=UPI0033012905